MRREDINIQLLSELIQSYTGLREFDNGLLKLGIDTSETVLGEVADGINKSVEIILGIDGNDMKSDLVIYALCSDKGLENILEDLLKLID